MSYLFARIRNLFGRFQICLDKHFRYLYADQRKERVVGRIWSIAKKKKKIHLSDTPPPLVNWFQLFTSVYTSVWLSLSLSPNKSFLVFWSEHAYPNSSEQIIYIFFHHTTHIITDFFWFNWYCILYANNFFLQSWKYYPKTLPICLF